MKPMRSYYNKWLITLTLTTLRGCFCNSLSMLVAINSRATERSTPQLATTQNYLQFFSFIRKVILKKLPSIFSLS